MGTAREQGQRNVAFNELNLRGIAINDATNNTASVTVYASDSGIMFVNEYAGTTTYTLPVVADCAGKMFFFYGNVGNDIVITGGTAAKMSGGTTSAAVDSDKVTGTGAIGIAAMVIGDGSSYFVIPFVGTWTGST